MFAEATVEARKRVRSRRNAKVNQQDRKHEQQEAAYAQGYYVEGGAQLDSEPLQSQLKLPKLHLKTASAAYCQLPEELRTSTLTFMDTAEELLTDAAAAYDKAISVAGFTTEGHKAFNASKAFLPITFSLIGPRLDTKHLKSGAQQMLEVERLLQQFSQALATVAGSLMGLVGMEGPRLPLALTALLDLLLTTGNVFLSTSTHPVIMALHQFELEDAEDAQHEQQQPQPSTEDPQAAGRLAKRRARRLARPGRIRGFVQALRPEATEADHRAAESTCGEASRGLRRAHPSSAITSVIGGATSSLQVARGKVGQQDDRALARELAREVILADLLEFHRLMEQFEEIREWLLT